MNNISNKITYQVREQIWSKISTPNTNIYIVAMNKIDEQVYEKFREETFETVYDIVISPIENQLFEKYK
jgi:phosphoribosyl-ATP pyrophosphohydrolase